MNKLRMLLKIGTAGIGIALLTILANSGVWTSPAPADAQKSSLSLTVYNQNLALVKDRRTLSLKAGLNTVQIADVAAQIDATSVHFKSLTDPNSTTVLEQNYEYDLVGSRKLLQKYVDQEITLITQDGSVYTGTLLSGAGDIILAGPSGAVTVVKSERVREFNFPKLPDGLITRPTLLWQLDATKPGRHDTEITYLTGGMNWQANYVASLAPDDKTLDLNGWVTVENHSGATYPEATLKLIAGDVRRVTQQLDRERGMVMEAQPAPTAAPQFQEKAFFEYHLYTLQRPTTLKDNSTKQIEFTSASAVPLNTVYLYDGAAISYHAGQRPLTEAQYGSTGNKKVNVILEFQNDKKSGMGIPLPKGTIRVYKEDDEGSSQFIGEDFIDHTPQDEPIRLHVGDAFDIIGEHVQTDFKKLGSHTIEESFEITLRNHKKETVTVRVIEHLFRWSEWEIVKETQDHTKVDSNTMEYRVRVPADGEAKVNYTVRYQF